MTPCKEKRLRWQLRESGIQLTEQHLQKIISLIDIAYLDGYDDGYDEGYKDGQIIRPAY